jgi:radical SAM protein with 4Fe4S-binding SPASM domain
MDKSENLVEKKFYERLYFHPEVEIIKNERIDQVALVKPISDSWIKLSGSAFDYILSLSEQSVSSINKSDFTEETYKSFVKLIEYLLNNEYLYNASVSDSSGFSLVDEYKKKATLSVQQAKKMVYLSITSACNLKCIHCYNNVKLPNDKTIEENKVHEILSRLKTTNIGHLVLTGGEPFLRKDFFEVLDKAVKIADKVSITTNGLLINLDTISTLSNYPKVKVSVSLDGLSAETHELLRGKNTFNKTLSVIKLLIKSGINTHVISTITRYNYKELAYFDDFIKELGATGNLSYYTPVGHGESSKDELSLRDEDIQDFARLLGLKSKNVNAEELEQNRNTTLPIKFNCSAGVNMLGIEDNGRVVPCHLFLGKDLSLGNLFEEPLIDMQKRWIKEKERIVDNSEACTACAVKHFCGNGCFANNYYNNGKNYGKDPNCTVIKTGIENKLWDLTN